MYVHMVCEVKVQDIHNAFSMNDDRLMTKEVKDSGQSGPKLSFSPVESVRE